ncbi:MAG: hypothetical protein ABIH24_04160 [Verrucomicrobiota bacterium]
MRNIIEAVVGVLQSGKVNYWTGNEGKNFEAECAAQIGYSAIACAMVSTINNRN